MSDDLSITCPNCGAVLPEGLEACSHCGALPAQPEVVEIEPGPPSPTEPEPEPSPAPIASPEPLPPPPQMKGKGSATCLVLIFMLGLMAAGATVYFLSR